MTPPNTPWAYNDNVSDERGRLNEPLGRRGSGGEPPDGVNRLVRLEEWARLSDSRFGRIEDKLDDILRVTDKLPTRAEMIGYAVGAFAVAAAIVGIIVAAMAWLETRAGRLDAQASVAPPAAISQLAPVKSR